MLKRSRLAMSTLQQHCHKLLQHLASGILPGDKCQCVHEQRHHISTQLATCAPKDMKTQSTRRVDYLSAFMDEPPLMAHGLAPPYSGSEIDEAIERLRRRLQRAAVHKQTIKRLESLWQMHRNIRMSCGWRMDAAELEQFLQAILRTGKGVAWGERANELVWEHQDALNASVAMWLLRVLSRSGNVQRFDEARGLFDRALGPGWDADQTEYLAVRAILYAKADLPIHATRALESCPGEIKPRSAEPEQQNNTFPTRILALSEIMLAWTRAKNSEKAWETISRLLVLGYGRKAREWNVLLHMHATDPRYRFDLLEEVLARMRQASVSYDAATYQIMLHACLLRGDQQKFREWRAQMERDGFAADARTYVVLAQQLAAAGRWSEARAALEQVSPDDPAQEAKEAVLASIAAATNQIPLIMQQFRKDALDKKPITAHQFSTVAVAALGCPGVWAAEIALLLRCLETGRVEESAAADAMAAQLPGLDRSRVAGRPLLHTTLQDAAQAFLDDLLNPVALGKRSQRLVPGTERRSYAAALGAVIRSLLRGGYEEQALQLLHAAEAAGISIGGPATMLALLRHCKKHPRHLAERIAATHFSQPTATVTALLHWQLSAGDVGAAQAQSTRLEQLVTQYPSIRGFNALLACARVAGDAAQLERTWRQMAAAGVLPNATSHITRITSYSQQDDQLHTRRAYSDMLQHGYPPTYAAVNAVVRCCVRTGGYGLALTVMRHAETAHSVSLNVTTYNYVISRLSSLPLMHARLHRLFAKMLGTPDERLVRPLAQLDVERRVAEERKLMDGMHVTSALRTDVGGVILRLDESESTAAMREALVGWLTSNEAFPAAHSMLNAPGQSPNGRASTKAAHPPPPNATTFIILVRMHGKRREWADVLRVWDALLAFNRRVENLGRTHAFANTFLVVPFGRILGWVILALHKVGREKDAGELWERALGQGFLGKNSVEKGMAAMIEHLMSKTEEND